MAFDSSAWGLGTAHGTGLLAGELDVSGTAGNALIDGATGWGPGHGTGCGCDQLDVSGSAGKSAIP